MVTYKKKGISVQFSEESHALIEKWASYFGMRKNPYCHHVIMNEIMELEKKEINKKNKDLKTEDESSHEI